MPRTARSCSGGYTYHVLNRGNARATVFHNPDDFDAFLDLMAESSVRTAMRSSSLRWLSSPAQAPVRLEPGTVPRGTLWVEGVNAVTSDVETQIIRESVRRDRPLGTSEWTLETAKALNLEYSLRPRGRPRGVERAGKDKTT
jgi:hypothetical protein